MLTGKEKKRMYQSIIDIAIGPDIDLIARLGIDDNGSHP